MLHAVRCDSALIVGAIIGALAGYYYAKRRYGRSQ